MKLNVLLWGLNLSVRILRGNVAGDGFSQKFSTQLYTNTLATYEKNTVMNIERYPTFAMHAARHFSKLVNVKIDFS